MAGNLAEWTADPAGILRGGDYVSGSLNGAGCLNSRTAHNFTFHDFATGFRCCADAQ
jgi:formylglycine-generating enzyme required for sulfatase activity